jgi:HD-GYP domain-containing protein (c-di-GMP phosphodiesterase class II)
MLSLESQHKHLAKLSVLQKIYTTFPVTDNIDVLTHRMLDLAVDSTEAEKGSVMLVNELGDLNILAFRGDDSRRMLTCGMKIGDGIAGKIAQQMEPTLVSDIEGDTRFKGKTRNSYKTNSFISCPIVGQSGLLGLININDKKDLKPFTEDQLVLVRIIADHSAVALEHAYRIKQLRAKSEELEETNRKLMGCEVSKAEFITRMSHDLRTPVNSIRGAVYYLQRADNTTKEEQAEFYGIIWNETSKLISALEGIFDQMGNGDKTGITHGRLINITELIREVAVLMSAKNRSSRKNVRLSSGVEDAVSDIVGDKIKIRQFFINLLDVLGLHLNNRDAISIGISENNFVEVTIEIPREMPDKVLSCLSDKTVALGCEISDAMIKLYLAKKVARLHHWNLNAKNIHNACQIMIRIPRSTRLKREVVINTIVEIFVDLLSEMLDIQTCSVMLYDDLTGDLTIRSSRGLSEDIVRQTSIKTGAMIAGQVAVKGEPLFIRDIETDLSGGHKNNPRYNTNSFISIPLRTDDKTIGVINLSNKENGNPFSITDFEIASLLGNRLSHFVEKFSSSDYNEGSFKQFVRSLESLLHIQKKYQKKHQSGADLTIKLLDTLGLSETDRKAVISVSALYDLGLMLIDESIFLKKKLLPEDVLRLKLHPVNTISVLDSLEFPEIIKNIILHHHERYDGMGYPNKLKGEEIPFLSRILSVVDSFSAMISERNYREKLTEEQALKEIIKGSGSLYDPGVVAALEAIVKPR